VFDELSDRDVDSEARAERLIETVQLVVTLEDKFPGRNGLKVPDSLEV